MMNLAPYMGKGHSTHCAKNVPTPTQNAIRDIRFMYATLSGEKYTLASKCVALSEIVPCSSSSIRLILVRS